MQGLTMKLLVFEGKMRHESVEMRGGCMYSRKVRIDALTWTLSLLAMMWDEWVDNKE